LFLAAAVDLFLLAGTSAGSQPPTTITVIGLADDSIDRQNIQDAIDAAKPRDTVELVGTFHLDGVQIFVRKSITIAGRAIDNDGDGEINEDWADGIDNDADGSIDEDDWDATVIGVADGDGTPAGDISPGELFNRGFTVDGITGTLRGLTIKNLKISTLHRGVSIQADHRFFSNLCDGPVFTGGTTDNVTITGNWFDNVFRGAQVFGASERFTVNDNLITRAESRGVLVVGGLAGCSGGGGPIEIGVPTHSQITHNQITGINSGTGIFVSRADRSDVVNNRVEGHNFGIIVSRGNGNSVFHNRVSAVFDGIRGRNTSPNTLFANNTVRDALRGIRLLPGATGFRVVNNDIVSQQVDVLLDGTSFENTIISTDFVTTVTDNGTDNKLVGTLAMINNPGVPEDVLAKLEELRVLLLH